MSSLERKYHHKEEREKTRGKVTIIISMEDVSDG
jgi:hypothetical protein